MRGRTVRLIALKELLDTLRDRRTLFVALVLPLLLYPALLLGLTQVIGMTQRNLDREHQRILVDGADRELTTLLREEELTPIEPDAADAVLRVTLREDLLALEGEQADVGRGRLRGTLERHEFAGAVLCAEDFDVRIRGDRQAEAVLLFDPTDEASKVARGKVRRALQNYIDARRKDLHGRFPDDLGRLRFAEAPVKLKEHEVASSAQKGAYSFAPLLGLLIVMMALTGAFYPAVDLAAGEKERGTLETLLVAPVTRREIVMGKFLAIWVIAIVTALLNLGVMAITFSKLAGMIGTERIAFALPLQTIVAVSFILIPTAALFSAIALALSSFATSYKEGQHYMTPLFVVVMPLALVAILPNVEIGYALAFVPIANVVLLVKAMLLGGEAMGPAVVAFLATAGYAAGALAVAVSIFRRESVLFRTGAGGSFDAVSLRAARAGLPAESRGLLLFFIVLALMFYLSSNIETPGQAIGAFLKAQLLAVLAPTLLFAYRLKVEPRRTFSLRLPRPAALLAVVVAAAATVTLMVAFQQYVMPQRDPQGFAHLISLLEEIPAWAYFCLLAVLPPICEELLCRGFLLSSLRPRFGWKAAVVISAVLFGALHLDWMRFPATFFAGLMLGYVCVRTGSLLAAILFHMVYNGTLATGLGSLLVHPSAWMIGAAVVALGGSIYALECCARPELTTTEPGVHSAVSTTTRP
ncbi:MAG: ABC transporter permease subunit/CPBP intramembrane protease [Planctomycetota bacterium]|jgi:sodium transport system permease protein